MRKHTTLNKNILCIIPAKATSARLKGKNGKMLADKPLLAYSIQAAQKSGLFEDIVVTTDSNRLAHIAKKYGAEIPCRRPKRLATGSTGVVDVCLHMIEYLSNNGRSYDVLCVLLPTSPLRTGKDIKKAHDLFRKKKKGFLMGVTEYRFEPFEALACTKNCEMHPYWGRKYAEMKRAERPRLFVDNGAVYIADMKKFRKQKTFYGRPLVGYYMPPERSVDINNAFDFRVAGMLLTQGEK